MVNKNVDMSFTIDDSNGKESRNSIEDIYGQRKGFFGAGTWPVRIDERVLEEPDSWVQSACILCSNDCALDIGVKNGKIVGVRGRGVDRTNRGRLGPKGLHGWVANNSSERLSYPLIRKNGKLERASWDEAMNLIVSRSKDIINKYSSNAVGFYTTGQLFIEEYFTIATVGKAGIGTPNMDGNTRLCTATAAAALMESFGSDGQPGSYTDIDETNTIFLVGHNMASQQTVLWTRILDRLAGPKPPKIIVMDPRTTMTAKNATIHLAPKVGTNVAVLNGLLNQIISNNLIDADYINAHTLGFDDLKKTVSSWSPERVEEVSLVPAKTLRAAAELLGTTPSLVSTVLQGVYQSNQATAAAVQVNNLHLIRGLIGKPGSGILQMNGQPTAQNTRECGDDGALPGFRNWDNPKHIEQLAKLWNVEKNIIPHWAPPTHASQIFRYAEEGSIKMLWIICTNPAVSMPDLPRMRKILSREDLFLVVEDIFLTETAEYADVVLPAAMWGEKTGTFTNVDRTVHISYKAVEPPGEARSDFDIFVDYANRMDFKDKDGKPLVKWSEPEEAFEFWRESTRGRPVDYTGLSYEKLSGGSGIQWPCNENAPDGTERLYTDGIFNTDPDYCEIYGHDLITGAAITPEEYRAKNPAGRAFLKAADYKPPHEEPSAEYPLWLTTGRRVYHFHTRTKTARSKRLNDAAPESFAQISESDANKYGLKEGDWVRISSVRGELQAPVKVGGIIDGHVFVPFHYGYWDKPGYPRAANELTIFAWDPVSKQPYFKYAAVKIEKIDAPVSEPSQPKEEKKEGVTDKSKTTIEQAASEVKQQVIPSNPEEIKNHIGDYVGMIDFGEQKYIEALEKIAERYKPQADVFFTCKMFAKWANATVTKLKPFVEKYSEKNENEPKKLSKVLFDEPRKGGFGLLRDLQDLYLFATENNISWLVLKQTSQGLRDNELENLCTEAVEKTERQISWFKTQIKVVSPQALIVPS